MFTGGDYDRAMIGISLLTLVPGELGGSETYVRELLRGLGRVGLHEYKVLLPPAAPTASEGLRAEIATEYRLAKTIPQRLVAMGAAAASPGPLRARLDGTRVVHYPLTIRIPPVDQPSVVTLLDVQHLDLPGMFSRSERLFRSVAWHRSARGAQRVITISEFVRKRAIERLRARPEAAARDSAWPRPRRAAAGDGRARAIPALPGTALAAQKPRPPVRSVRSSAP